MPRHNFPLLTPCDSPEQSSHAWQAGHCNDQHPLGRAPRPTWADRLTSPTVERKQGVKKQGVKKQHETQRLSKQRRRPPGPLLYALHGVRTRQSALLVPHLPTKLALTSLLLFCDILPTATNQRSGQPIELRHPPETRRIILWPFLALRRRGAFNFIDVHSLHIRIGKRLLTTDRDRRLSWT